MSKEARLSPVELLRQLTLSVERLAAQGLASGAVRGAAEELRAGLPEFDGQLQVLLQDVLTILGRMAHEAAGRPASSAEAWSQLVAEGAVRGAVEGLRRSMPGLDAFSQELLQRLDGLLERSARIADSREEERRKLGARARIAAAGAVGGAVGELHASMPRLEQVAAGLSSQVGHGFAEGLGAEVQARSEFFAAFLDRAGRSFVHALVEQLDTELKARRPVPEGALRRDTVAVAEQVAAACVRGATEEMVRQSSGLLATLGARLRGPLVLTAGTGGALLLAALVIMKVR